MTEQEFVEALLKKSSDQREGLFSPTEVRIDEIKDFDYLIAEQLATKKVEPMSVEKGVNEEIVRREKFSGPLINLSKEKGVISFYPHLLREYLKDF